MPRTRRQSAPSDESISEGWESDSNASVPSSPSPSSTQNLPSDSEHIPRPPNRFILYRKHAWKVRKEQAARNNVVDNITVSAFGVLIGPLWRNEPPEVKAYWQEQAVAAKREHEARYPGYQYRPTPGGRSRSAGEVKRAPGRPRSNGNVRPVEGKERKEATPSEAERSMKTRSMTRQRQVVEVRTGALERKASVAEKRGLKSTTSRTTATSPRSERRRTERTTRQAVIDLTADSDDEGVPVEGPTQNQNALGVSNSPVTQGATQPRLAVGHGVSPPTARLPELPVAGGIFSPSFDLPVGGGIAPVQQALPVHSQFPNTFNQSFAYSEPQPEPESQPEWPEHDRPSLWDSPDLPLFPPEILEDHESGSASQYHTGGFSDNWSHWPQRQPTFLVGFGSAPSQPMVQVDPLLSGWPTCGSQYLGQHLGPFPGPQAPWTAYA